jgi:hypothetical protein
MKVHALLAAFILPAAIMFFVTGALYTWGIKGNYDTSTHELHLKKPIQGELDELIALAKKELQKKDLEEPSGHAKIKRIGASFRLEWTGSNMDIIIEPTSQPLIAKLEIKNTGWHRQFVQLHKAKGDISHLFFYLCLTPASVDVKRGAFFASAKKVTLFTVNWMHWLCIFLLQNIFMNDC